MKHEAAAMRQLLGFVTNPAHGMLLLACLVAIRTWSLYAVPEHGSWVIIEKAILVYLVGMTLLSLLRPWRSEVPMAFGWTVGLILACQAFSWIQALAVHDQSLRYSLTGSFFIFFWLVYFLLHYHDVPPERVIVGILAIGLIWAFINTFQQFTYPRFWFFSRLDENGEVELRAGVRRFMTYGMQFATFSFFYFFNRLIVTGARRHMAGLLAITLGIYYYGTRQVLFTTIIVLVLTAFQYTNARRWKFTPMQIAAGLLVLAVGSLVFEPLLGRFIEMTLSESDQPSYRTLSYEWYGLHYWKHWTCYLFGNGMADSRSAFGQEIMSFQAQGLYQVDIGIVGAWSMYGAIFVLVVVTSFVRALLVPQEGGTLYLRAMFLFAFLNLWVATFFPEGESYTFYSFLFYLMDHRVAESRQIPSTTGPAPAARPAQSGRFSWYRFVGRNT